jgi:probable HAF family extracellular repeat protein
LPNALNAKGQVVGMSDTFAEAGHAFLWSGSGLQDLGTLETPYNYSSNAFGINAGGQVAGWYNTTSGPYHAFL